MMLKLCVFFNNSSSLKVQTRGPAYIGQPQLYQLLDRCFNLVRGPHKKTLVDVVATQKYGLSQDGVEPPT